MGGQRALEWAASGPGAGRGLAAIATTAQTSGDQIAGFHTQLAAIRADPGYRGGDYYDAADGHGPHVGLGLARQIAHHTYRSAAELDARFGRIPQGGEEPLSGGRFAVQSYLDHHGDKLSRRFDANSYVVLTRTMITHDLGRDRGGVEAALARSPPGRWSSPSTPTGSSRPRSPRGSPPASRPPSRCGRSTPTTATTASWSRRTWWVATCRSSWSRGRTAELLWEDEIGEERQAGTMGAMPSGDLADAGTALHAQWDRLRSWVTDVVDDDVADDPSVLDGWTVAELVAHLGRAMEALAVCSPLPEGTVPYTLGEYVGTYLDARRGHRGDHAEAGGRDRARPDGRDRLPRPRGVRQARRAGP